MSKEILIMAGGYINQDFAKEYIACHSFDYCIVADKGLEMANALHISMDMILGDMDSVSQSLLKEYEKLHIKMLRFPTRKDLTDMELAICEAETMGATHITIMGGTGTRIDHMMGTFNAMAAACMKGYPVTLVDEHNRVQMMNQSIAIYRKEQFGKYVSLLPYTETVTGLTLTGFSYPVKNGTLTKLNALGVSNQITEEKAIIEVKSGWLYVIESRD